MSRIEVILTDVRQTKVIAHLRKEKVELDTTADTQTAVKTLERIVSKRVVELPLVLRLDLPADAQSTIDADKRLDAGLVVQVVLVLFSPLKVTFSSLKVTFRIVKTTFSRLKVIFSRLKVIFSDEFSRKSEAKGHLF